MIKKDNKTVRFNFRCKIVDKIIIEEKAKNAGYKSISHFIRDRCLRDTEIVLSASNFVRVLNDTGYLLGKTSGNINQLVKAINVDIKSKDFISQSNYDAVVEAIMQHNSRVMSLTDEIKKLLRHAGGRKRKKKDTGSIPPLVSHSAPKT